MADLRSGVPAGSDPFGVTPCELHRRADRVLRAAPAAASARACSGRSPPRRGPASPGSGRARSARSRRSGESSSIARNSAGGLVVAADPEVRDPERLADRGLVRLAPLRLLERHGRLGGHPLLEMPAALLEVVVDLAHSASQIRKVLLQTVKRMRQVAGRADLDAVDDLAPRRPVAETPAASSYGGPPSSSSMRRVERPRRAARAAPRASRFAGSSSSTFATRPSSIPSA